MSPAGICWLTPHKCNFYASNPATSMILICNDGLREWADIWWQKATNKHAARGPYSWNLALVVYRTAVNIWPSPSHCQLARDTADIYVSKQTAKKQTSEQHKAIAQSLIQTRGILTGKKKLLKQKEKEEKFGFHFHLGCRLKKNVQTTWRSAKLGQVPECKQNVLIGIFKSFETLFQGYFEQQDVNKYRDQKSQYEYKFECNLILFL